MTRSMLIGLAACAVAFPAAAQDQRLPVLPDGTLLEVSAEGISTRVPDVAMIQAGVISTSATASEAMSQNADRMRAVLAALRKAGIAERDIQTAAISLSPQYRYQQNEAPVLTGYQASNQVSVRFRDVAKSGAILDALVAQGANNIAGPNLTIDKPDAALDEARTDAIARARARAELYARAAGLKVDRIVSISESGGMSAPMPIVAFRAKAEAAADTQIVAGEQQLGVTVTVRFLLK